VRELFKKIQVQENASLDITSNTEGGRGIGVREEQETYDLKIKYNGCTIKIACGLGRQSAAIITCVISQNNTINNFEITTRNHLAILFSSNKNRFTLETEDSILQKFIENNTAYQELHAVSKRTKFLPTITGTNNEESYKLLTEYDLFFDQRNETFMPLIQFYKDLIDYFG
jgi:hypothetical protein